MSGALEDAAVSEVDDGSLADAAIPPPDTATAPDSTPLLDTTEPPDTPDTTMAPDTTTAPDSTPLPDSSAPDTTTPPDTAPDSTAPDAATPPDTTASDSGPSDPQCGVHKGGPMVWSGSGAKFCIDAREVTRAEYDTFLAAAPTDPQPDYCDWNKSYDALPSTFGGNFPITGIDWCDAIAYCSWAGKHVCGAITDGKILADESAAKSQWTFACLNGDGAATTGYPTGPSAPAAGVCRLGGVSAPAAVQTHLMCKGTTAPWDRVFDLSGNAAEWDGAGCFLSGLKPGTTPEQRRFIDCGVRGGSYFNDIVSGRCITGVSRPIDERDEKIGFRCCKGP